MKILLWDIETSLMIAAVFGRFKQDIQYDNILQDWYIHSIAWKWLGQKRVYAVSGLDDKKRFKKDHTDDYHVVKTVADVINQADVIVGHNGDAFDIKKFKARCIALGLPPIKEPLFVDTLKAARQAKFTSNKLDDLGSILGIGNKIDNPRGLWLKALHGDEKAIKQMVKYNKQDVLLLEQLYLKLRPYMKSHPNQNLFSAGRDVCSKCGSDDIQYRGYLLTKTAKKRRYQCNSCGGYSASGKNEIKGVNLR